MDKKNIIPQAAKPVVRVTQGTQGNYGELGLTPLGARETCICTRFKGENPSTPPNSPR